MKAPNVVTNKVNPMANTQAVQSAPKNGKPAEAPKSEETKAAIPETIAIPARPKPNEVKIIRLVDILADPALNSRSVGNTTMSRGSLTSPDDETTDGTGFEGFCADLVKDGQDTPVDIRVNKNAGKGEPKYLLVTGFRRYRAIETIASAGQRVGNDPNWNPKNPTIRVFDHGIMSDADAWDMNIRENTQRDDLTGPDLGWGIMQRVKAQPGVTDTYLAASFGLTQGHVSMLRRIFEKLDPRVTTDWRARPGAEKLVSIKELDALVKEKLPESEHWPRYEKLLNAKESQKGQSKWIQSALKRAEDIGAVLGKLTAAEFNFDAPDVGDFKDAIFEIMRKPKKTPPTAKEIKKVAAAMNDAFVKAQLAAKKNEESEDDEDEESEDDEDEE